VDVDLAVAGALLHDLGKVTAYRLSPAPEMTLEGSTVDHIALGYAQLREYARRFELDQRIALSLEHILLSHHGSREFGSPVLPETSEALIVAAADQLDFQLFCWKEAVSGMEAGKEVSEFHFALQRRFWKGTHDFPQAGQHDASAKRLPKS
jgi:3'-5' exoribonuclease